MTLFYNSLLLSSPFFSNFSLCSDLCIQDLLWLPILWKNYAVKERKYLYIGLKLSNGFLHCLTRNWCLSTFSDNVLPWAYFLNLLWFKWYISNFQLAKFVIITSKKSTRWWGNWLDVSPKSSISWLYSVM